MSQNLGGGPDANADTQAEMRRRRLEALEARNSAAQQQAAQTGAPLVNNFRKRDWKDPQTSNLQEDIETDSKRSKIEGLTVEEVAKRVAEEEGESTAGKRTVLKNGVLVREKSPAAPAPGDFVISDLTGESPKGSPKQASNETSGLSSPKPNASPQASANGIATSPKPDTKDDAWKDISNLKPLPGVISSGGPPASSRPGQNASNPDAAAIQRMMQALLQGANPGNSEPELMEPPTTVHIAPDLLESLAKRIKSGDLNDRPDDKVICDYLIGSAYKIKHLQEEAKILEAALQVQGQAANRNLSVLKTIDQLLDHSTLRMMKQDGDEEEGGVSQPQEQAQKQEEQPKSYLIKRGDRSGGGAVGGSGTGNPSPGYTSPGLGASGSGHFYTVPISGQALGTGATTGADVDAALSKEEKDRHKADRLARLEQQQAQQKKERDEAEKKQKARDALCGGR